jgi:predicted DsbA family dithiol-disulfide isomerase
MTTQEVNTAHINFHFDPQCPFAWRTAVWAREARQVRPLEISWRFFSLEVINRPAGTQPDYISSGWTALRTLALVRRSHGNEGVEKLYVELGNAAHGRKESIRERSVVEACVEAAGFEADLVEKALADASTITDVTNDHEESVKRYHAFGVPTIALEGSDIGIYGPVIVTVPRGEEAGELWDHFSWTLKYDNLYEIKRDRAAGPPLGPITA